MYLSWYTLVLFQLVITDGHAEVMVFKKPEDFVTALTTCRHQGEGWTLVDGQSGDAELLTAMKRNHIGVIWLAVRKHVLDNWRWVDGVPYDDFNGEDVGNRCALLTIRGEIISSTCRAGQAGYACQISKNVECPSNFPCVLLNKTNFYIDCSPKNWYAAREECKFVHGDLLKLNTTEERLRAMNQLGELSQCQQVFIGLFRENWLSVALKPEGVTVTSSHWGPGEPSFSHGKACVEMRVKQGRQEWRTQSCLHKNPFICHNGMDTGSYTTKAAYVHDIVTTASTIEPSDKGRVRPKPGIRAEEVTIYTLGAVTCLLLLIAITAFRRHMMKCIRRCKWQKRGKPAQSSEQRSFYEESFHSPEERVPLAVSESIDQPTSSVVNLMPDINRDKGKIVLLMCLTQKIQIKHSESIEVIDEDIFKMSNIKEQDTETTMITINFNCEDVLLVNVICRNPKLDANDTEKLLRYILSYTRYKLDVIHLPGLTFNKTSYDLIRQIRGTVPTVCIAESGFCDETAAECIAVGLVYGDHRRLNSGVIENGTLDFVIQVSRNSMMVQFWLEEYLEALLTIVKHLWINKEDKTGKHATNFVRRETINCIKELSRPDHNCQRGFGIFNTDLTFSRDSPRTVCVNPLRRRRRLTKPIRIAVASTGLESSPEISEWKVTPLQKEATGDKDTTWRRGTKSVHLLIDTMKRQDLKETDVEMCYCVIDKCRKTTDWKDYSSCLSNILERGFDIVYISSGLGKPPDDSDIPKLFDEIVSKSIVITSAFSSSDNPLVADFPASSAIVVRNAHGRQEGPMDSTVDFEAVKRDQLAYNDEAWAGGIRVVSTVTRILLQILRNAESLPPGLPDAAVSTVVMREILDRVCCKGTLPDGVAVIDPDTVFTSEIIDIVRNCENDNTYLWAGKRQFST